MKSFLKKFLAVAVSCILIVSMMMLVACGETPADSSTQPAASDSSSTQPAASDSSNGGSGSSGDYVFEAELTCADAWTGGGWSGSASGTGLIVPDENSVGASNGFYLTYTWSEDLCIYFEISSSKDTTAQLSLRLGNEIEAVELNPERFAVVVNDVDFEYTPFTLLAGDYETHSASRFDDYAIGEISLKQGSNRIELWVGNWRFDESHVFGPAIDAIKLSTDARLSMITYDENIANIA